MHTLLLSLHTGVLSRWRVVRCLRACKGARNRGRWERGHGEVPRQENGPEAAAVLALAAARLVAGLTTRATVRAALVVDIHAAAGCLVASSASAMAARAMVSGQSSDGQSPSGTGSSPR